MQEIEDILNCIEPIDLKGMDGVRLMDRTDTKFTFDYSQLNNILLVIAPYYRVLEIDHKRVFLYRTLYYDTTELKLYTGHHSGKLNRYKIRQRSYVETDTAYLEVKFKSNKGRTIKERIKNLKVSDTWSENEIAFLEKKLPFDPMTLKPCLWVNYSRITLVNKQSAERVTIDLGLNFASDTDEQRFDNLVIAEVKQEKRQVSRFLEVMKELKIKQGSISKYCLGVAVMIKGVKRNNFKESIQSLKNITGYDYNTITD